METIISIAALIIGFIISKILSSQKANLLSQELVSLKETNEQLNQKNKSLAESKEQLVIEKSKLEAHNANLQENLKNQKLKTGAWSHLTGLTRLSRLQSCNALFNRRVRAEQLSNSASNS